MNSSAAIPLANLQWQEGFSTPKHQHQPGQKAPKYKAAPSSHWQFAVCTAKAAQDQGAGPSVPAASLELSRFPLTEQKQHRAASWTQSCCCSHEGCSGSHWQRRWRTALEGGESSCCAPVTSNSNGLDYQETCAWSSMEPQTCSETSRSCPPFPKITNLERDELGTHRKHHICWNRGTRGHHFHFPVPRVKHQSLSSHSWDTHSKKTAIQPCFRGQEQLRGPWQHHQHRSMATNTCQKEAYCGTPRNPKSWRQGGLQPGYTLRHILRTTVRQQS